MQAQIYQKKQCSPRKQFLRIFSTSIKGTCHFSGFIVSGTKAVQSLAKLRTANSLSVHSSVHPCLVRHLTVISVCPTIHQCYSTQNNRSDHDSIHKKTHALKTPHVVFLPVIFLSFFLFHGQGSQKSMERPNEHFLSLDLMTLTFDL